MSGEALQSKLLGLLEGEQVLQGQALQVVANDPKVIQHLEVVEAAMDLIDQFSIVTRYG